MLWGTVLKRKNDILRNVSEQKWCKVMLSALREDVYVDAYQDTQPGGGNCLSNNYKKQQEYENKLSDLYNIRLLFPKAQAKDILILEYFMQKLEDLQREQPVYFESSELTDYTEQAFLFYKYFASHQMDKKSIDQFCKIGEYIVNQTVKWDSEKELFFQVIPISFNMFFAITEI